MGLFGLFTYNSTDGKKYYLHMKEQHNVKLYYMSKNPTGALQNMPKGYIVIENKKTHMPMLKNNVLCQSPLNDVLKQNLLSWLNSEMIAANKCLFEAYPYLIPYFLQLLSKKHLNKNKFHLLCSLDSRNLIPRALAEIAPRTKPSPVVNTLSIKAAEIAISFGTPSFIKNRTMPASFTPRPIGIIETVAIKVVIN